MKKYYFFAALATVGLFASCSSDEDFNDAADARQAINAVDDNTPAKIEIGLADNVEVSRGTGRVGDGTAAASAQWAGQTFNVLMLEKNTMMGARLTPNDPTTAIFKGIGMTATGTNVVSLDTEARYYPNYKQDGVSAGVYDFWGYRLDNSETPTAGTPVFNGYDVAAADASYTWGAAQTDAPANVEAGDIAELNAAPTTTTVGVAEKWYKYTDNNNTPDDTTDDVLKYVQCTAVSGASAAANQISVPFKINGTQDIMIAVTNPSDAAYATANPAAIYSAKSARNGVKPTMTFKHLLTSLTFKVKPKSRDISDQATNPTTDGNWRAGYQITNITLKSKATGELIVAYTPDNVVADENRIIWADGQDWADPTSLTAFQLQCRPKAIANKADIKMVAVRSDAQTGFVINYASGYESAAGVTSYTVGADLLTMTVYDSGEVYDGNNETGLPKGNATTLQAMKDANPNAAYVTGYIRTYKQGNRSPFATTTSYNECDYSANAAGVTENLAPFYDNAEVYKTVLDWDGYTAGSAAHTDWVASNATEYAAAGTNAIDTYAAVAYDAATHDVLLVQANDGKIYNFNGVYKKVVYTSAVDPSAGNAVAQQIGEPMLVAPSNDDANSGYQVVVTYKYWKKKTAAKADLIEVDSKPITVNNYTIDSASGNKIPGAFEAGKNYNVTITLYSDGEVLNGDATSEPWVDGGNLDAGDDE